MPYAIVQWLCTSRQRRMRRLVVQSALERIPANRRILVSLQLGHIFRGEFETVQLCVLLDSRGRHALWQRDQALLQAPPEQDLCLRLTVLLG